MFSDVSPNTKPSQSSDAASPVSPALSAASGCSQFSYYSLSSGDESAQVSVEPGQDAPGTGRVVVRKKRDRKKRPKPPEADHVAVERRERTNTGTPLARRVKPRHEGRRLRHKGKLLPQPRRTKGQRPDESVAQWGFAHRLQNSGVTVHGQLLGSRGAFVAGFTDSELRRENCTLPLVNAEELYARDAYRQGRRVSPQPLANPPAQVANGKFTKILYGVVTRRVLQDCKDHPHVYEDVLTGETVRSANAQLEQHQIENVEGARCHVFARQHSGVRVAPGTAQSNQFDSVYERLVSKLVNDYGLALRVTVVLNYEQGVILPAKDIYLEIYHPIEQDVVTPGNLETQGYKLGKFLGAVYVPIDSRTLDRPHPKDNEVLLEMVLRRIKQNGFVHTKLATPVSQRKHRTYPGSAPARLRGEREKPSFSSVPSFELPPVVPELPAFSPPVTSSPWSGDMFPELPARGDEGRRGQKRHKGIAFDTDENTPPSQTHSLTSETESDTDGQSADEMARERGEKRVRKLGPSGQFAAPSAFFGGYNTRARLAAAASSCADSVGLPTHQMVLPRVF